MDNIDSDSPLAQNGSPIPQNIQNTVEATGSQDAPGAASANSALDGAGSPSDGGSLLQIQEGIVEMLRTVFDPEIPVNIYDLGMIYKIDVDEASGSVTIQMTLTAPNCPAADFLVEDVTQKVESVPGVSKAVVQLVFEPQWDQSMMTDEARLELGLM